MIRFAFLFIFSLTLMANRCTPENIQQGIAGKVLWIAGDQMPGIVDERNPHPKRTAPAPAGIEREIFIYEPTTSEQATGNGFFYSDIQTKLVEKIKSDSAGNFAVALPAGTYSVFIQEDEGLFANLIDGNGYINPIEVQQDSVTEVAIRVDYKAAY